MVLWFRVTASSTAHMVTVLHPSSALEIEIITHRIDEQQRQLSMLTKEMGVCLRLEHLQRLIPTASSS